jgi:hypothetical protein
MQKMLLCGHLLSGSLTASVFAQDNAGKKMKAEDLPTSGLISAPGASFVAANVKKAPTVIVFGDQRFTVGRQLSLLVGSGLGLYREGRPAAQQR